MIEVQSTTNPKFTLLIKPKNSTLKGVGNADFSGTGLGLYIKGEDEDLRAFLKKVGETAPLEQKKEGDGSILITTTSPDMHTSALFEIPEIMKRFKEIGIGFPERIIQEKLRENFNSQSTGTPASL